MSDEEKDLLDVVIDEKSEQKKDEPIVLLEGEDEVKEVDDNIKDENDPDKVIKKLETKLKKEKEAREKAERQSAIFKQQAKQNLESDHETKTQLVASAIEKIKVDNEILTNQLAEAIAANDSSRAAQLNVSIATNAAKLTQLETGYDDMKRNPPKASFQDNQAKSGSMFDQIVDNVSEKSARWLNEHREHLEDDRAIRKMFRAHEDAIDDGIKPDTKEYFSYIEKRLGLATETKSREESRSTDEGDSPLSSAAKQVRSVSPPAAPVERGGNRSNVVRLTKAEVETAQMLGMTEKEYATHKLALQKAGKLPH